MTQRRRKTPALKFWVLFAACAITTFIVFGSNLKSVFEKDVIVPTAILPNSPETIIQNSPNTIYLTFDDGPSEYTNRLLDILKEYDVKATFFITNSGDDSIITRAYCEGHTIAIHTASHNYSYIYKNTVNFFDDLSIIQARIQNLTGSTTTLMRFPGGSSNTVSRRYDGKSHIMTRLVSEIKERGYVYFDWNIDSNDAGGANTVDEIANNIIDALHHDGPYVVLQHDTKANSIEAVRQVVEYGRKNGYVFAALKDYSFAAHHGINN